VAAAAMTGVGLAAAPALGGALGTMVGGYSGAAATSYGLAMLGGGSLAAEGLGMAGGTAVIGAVGASLGGALGASITNSYIGEDKSFRIERLRDGEGVPVVLASGFMTQGKDAWGGWQEVVDQRYADSPVYWVHWGSKELAGLAIVLGVGAGRRVATQALKKAALKATSKGTKMLNPIGMGLIAVDLVKNPWHTAKERADKTGMVVADLLARTDARGYVLMGHSLGARAMVTAAQSLGTKPGAPKVMTMHLLGAAIGAKQDWRTLNDAVSGRVFNYYSVNDKVLRFLYSTVQPGQTAAGLKGFKTAFPKIKDVNVSSGVKGHSEYVGFVKLSGT